MSDVSALVLSIGETYTERALASLDTQTLPPADVVVVRNVSPFSSAMNAGIRRIKTRFFVQVDADMVLDPECFEVLRSAATGDAGMVVGKLRDPLMGHVVGVKLFRTSCLERFPFRDSVSPDTDHLKEIERIGMRVVYLGDPAAADDEQQSTFGDHLPEYTAAYTYRKFSIEGARLRYRGSRAGLKWRLRRLEMSAHPLALMACVAMADGFFDRSDMDALKPFTDNGDADRIAALLESSGEHDLTSSGLFPLDPRERLRETFRRFFQSGRQIAHAGAGRTARAVFDSLKDRGGKDMRVSVAAVAFGRGLTCPNRDAHGISCDEEMMRRFVTLGLRSKAGTTEVFRARAVRWGSFVGLGEPAARW